MSLSFRYLTLTNEILPTTQVFGIEIILFDQVKTSYYSDFKL